MEKPKTSKTLLQRIEDLEAVVFGGDYLNAPPMVVDDEDMSAFTEKIAAGEIGVYKPQNETTAILPDEEEAQTDGEVETDDDEQDDE